MGRFFGEENGRVEDQGGGNVERDRRGWGEDRESHFRGTRESKEGKISSDSQVVMLGSVKWVSYFD